REDSTNLCHCRDRDDRRVNEASALVTSRRIRVDRQCDPRSQRPERMRATAVLGRRRRRRPETRRARRHYALNRPAWVDSSAVSHEGTMTLRHPGYRRTPKHEPFQCWHPPSGQVEHRYVEGFDPWPRSDESNAELSGIDEQGAEIPATRLRKIASRIEPLEDEELCCCDHHEDAGKNHRVLCRPQPQRYVATSTRKAS